MFLERLKKEHVNAVHHCFAYRLGDSGLEYRMSDDGEPSGTAGKPILFAMQKADISDAIVIVVRYYGGTKLGVGPLARAYTETAQLVLETSTKILVEPKERLMIYCEYDDVSRITMLLEEVQAEFIPSYADTISFEVELRSAVSEYIQKEVVERTSGRAGVSKINTEGK